MQTTTAIVGAGLAGLTCARALAQAGRPVALFDKGRKPAGRISSRRAAPELTFDHGAQYFTARGADFRAEVERWLAGGVAEPWKGRITALAGSGPNAGQNPGRQDSNGSKEPPIRYVGVPTMSAIAGHLTRELEAGGGVEVRAGTRVGALSRAGSSSWELTDDGGISLGSYREVVVALPAQQAVRLLSDPEAEPLRAQAASVELRPCWAVMLGLDEPYAVDFDGAFCGGALSWVARNSSKPGRPPGEAWVLHGSTEWTSAFLELDRPTVIAKLSAELEALTGAPLPPVRHAAAHHWRFSIADRPLEIGAAFDPASGLGLAGDWCAGSRVEGAWLSGRELARRMLSEGSSE